MERHNWRPIYVHGMSLEGSFLSDATHAQLEPFYSLPPDAQAKVYLNEFSIEEVRDSRNYRCNSPYRSCVLRFCLYGFFNMPEAAEEYPPLPPARHVPEVQGEERSPTGAAQRMA